METRQGGVLLPSFAALQPTIPAIAERRDDLWRQLVQEVEQIIAEQRLTTVFQPIRRLADGRLLGYEALSRITLGGRLTRPDELFTVAGLSGHLFPLERLCREIALRRAAASVGPKLRLFLNIDPRVVDQPDFHPGVTRELLQSTGRPASSLVLEITERSAIADFRSFRRALGHYSRQGFSVAIDDVGSGYSSLQAIVELKPQFLKIDMSLVRGIARSRTKQVLVEAITTVGRRLGVQTVAEGIETPAELRALVKLGADYGQGYLLGRPNERPVEEEEEGSAWPR